MKITTSLAVLSVLAFAALNVGGAPTTLCPPFGWAENLVNFTKPGAQISTNNTPLTADDCAFQQWSWEAFVWATALGANRQPRFLGLPTLEDLSPSAAYKANPKKLVLRPRSVKPRGSQQDIDEFQQAGSQGIITDQTGQPVFYSVHMNEAYFNFANQFYGRANYAKASATTNFPIGAAVLKASWQVLSGSVSEIYPTGVFTTPAIVPVLANSTKGIVVDPSGKTRSVTVALVGLHVVGVTINHPEFIWATFEHANNAPSLINPNGYNSPNPVSSRSFTFYKAGTAANACNQLVTERILDPARQTIAPIPNIFRQYAYGSAAPNRVADITNVTAQAHGALAKMGGGEAVWTNYNLIGTVWLLANTLKPGNTNLNQAAIASTNLANATMETYVQGMQNNNNQAANCFMCHDTAGYSKYGIPGKNINLSHVILDPLFNAPGAKRTN